MTILKKPFNILFVDDEEHNLVSFNATFRKEYKIFLAQGAHEALEVLRKQPIQLVITDQRMPKMTGVEFLKHVVILYPETIRILLTGYSDIEAVIEAINNGKIFRYINKPWDDRDLRMTIESARQMYALKQDNIAFQFEILKNQVNPHFLFNSLNVLSSLIYINQDDAAKFVRQLSKLYRHLLDNRNVETITIKEELDILDAYIYLLKTRFDQNLFIEIDIPESLLQKEIVPMALQMLLENSVKHNIISKTMPLNVAIGIENNEYVFVSNNLQTKALVEPSPKLGLENINKRYRYLCDKEIEIIRNTEFKVKLPLI